MERRVPSNAQRLEDFVKELREDVLKFERMWVRENKKTPDRYPMTLSPGDWFEQFLSFVTTERGS